MAKPIKSPARNRWASLGHDQRSALIIDTAIGFLKHHTLRAVTMRRVSKKLGVGAMTLYTYVNGQRDLYYQMTRRGFEMLHENCDASSTLGTAEEWRGGSKAYLRFAMTHPRLYELMFSTPVSEGGADDQLMRGGFTPLFDKTRAQLAARGLTGKKLEQATLHTAGRFWIALHGLATLAIAGRLNILGGDLDALLDDLLKHVAPDKAQA